VSAREAAQARADAEASADHEIQQAGELEDRHRDACQEYDQGDGVLPALREAYHAIPDRALTVGAVEMHAQDRIEVGREVEDQRRDGERRGDLKAAVRSLAH